MDKYVKQLVEPASSGCLKHTT